MQQHMSVITLAEQTRPGCKRFLVLLQAEDLRAAVQLLQGQGFKVEAILGERLGIIFWRPAGPTRPTP